jgi:hypothetical protein
VISLIILVAGVVYVAFYGSPPKQKYCTTEACFNPEFRNCAPATFDYSLKNAGTIQYKIIGSGQTGSGCIVTIVYTDYPPNPAWANKPMTCTFNNQIHIRQSASNVYTDLIAGRNTYGCAGPLVPIIQEYGSAK